MTILHEQSPTANNTGAAGSPAQDAGHALPMNQRDDRWDQLAGPWDVLVIGGGITGAGIFREAVRAGLRTLLVEQRDFAWGASGRSSSLVHGGLRYLFKGQLEVT